MHSRAAVSSGKMGRKTGSVIPSPDWFVPDFKPLSRRIFSLRWLDFRMCFVVILSVLIRGEWWNIDEILMAGLMDCLDWIAWIAGSFIM
jgi:hypothetical protein